MTVFNPAPPMLGTMTVPLSLSIPCSDLVLHVFRLV
jgi:hypothetical protein